MTSPDSLTAGLLREAGVGVCVAPDDAEAITHTLLNLFAQWQQGNVIARSTAGFLERFERGRLTARLAGVLDDAAAGGTTQVSQTNAPPVPRNQFAA
jgi:hypothetical protein